MHQLRYGMGLALLLGAVGARAGEMPAGMRAEADAMLRHDIDAHGPGAAVLVARGDDVLYRAARGLADVELGVPIAPDHVFRIGSITKSVTAATVLRLAEQGRLSLADPLSRFLPAFPNAARITIAELLDHTAGVSDAWDVSACQTLDTATLVERIAHQPPDFAPGAAWRYSNSGYLLLGAVIGKITGRSWDRAEHDLVLAPVGLAHTAYYADDVVVPGRVQGYSVDAAGRLARPPYVSISGPQAAGALSSTVDDIFRFVRGLATGRVLSSRAFADMTTAKHTADGHPVAYGYGVVVGALRGEPAIGHDGGIEGFASEYVYLPREQITAVVLANSDAGEPNARSLARRLAALAAGRPYRTFRDVPVDARALHALAGTYRIEGESRHVLSVEDQRLWMRRDGGPARRVSVADGDVLYYTGDGTDYFQIVRDGGGRVTALDFHVDGMPATRRELRLPDPRR